MKTHAILWTAILLLSCLANSVQVHAPDWNGRISHCGPRHYLLPEINVSEVHTVNGVGFVPVPDVLRRHLPDLNAGEGLMVASFWTCSSIELSLGDILISVDGQKVTDFESLPEQVLGKKLSVIRNGKLMDPSAVLARPLLPTQLRVVLPAGSKK